MKSFCLAILLLSAQIQAQPTIVFDKNVQFGRMAYLDDVILTHDNGFALLLNHCSITRLSAEGDSLWTTILDDSLKGSYGAMAETPEGDLLLLGNQFPQLNEYLRHISTPETRRALPYVALISQSGEFISENVLGENKYQMAHCLIPSASGYWGLFIDYGFHGDRDRICENAYRPTMNVIYFTLPGKISWSETMTLEREPIGRLGLFNPIIAQTEPFTDRFTLGITKDTNPPFRIDPYHPPHEILMYRGTPCFGVLDSMGRDTLDIDLITIDPASCERQMDYVQHYEDFIGKELDGIYLLNENFWFYSDSKYATSIENRKIRIRGTGQTGIIPVTNHFIVNDWDSTGSLVKHSVVDFEFDYVKYAGFRNCSLYKSADNSFIVAGEANENGSFQTIFVSMFDRERLRWFWTYEAHEMGLDIQDVFWGDDQPTLYLIGAQYGSDFEMRIKVIKLQLPD